MSIEGIEKRYLSVSKIIYKSKSYIMALDKSQRGSAPSLPV